MATPESLKKTLETNKRYDGCLLDNRGRKNNKAPYNNLYGALH